MVRLLHICPILQFIMARLLMMAGCSALAASIVTRAIAGIVVACRCSRGIVCLCCRAGGICGLAYAFGLALWLLAAWIAGIERSARLTCSLRCGWSWLHVYVRWGNSVTGRHPIARHLPLGNPPCAI